MSVDVEQTPAHGPPARSLWRGDRPDPAARDAVMLTVTEEPGFRREPRGDGLA